MSEYQNRRWYDRDPILSKSMRILETSDDALQIQMAINLIKVIIEHNIENNSFTSVEDLMTAVEDGRLEKGNTRWYDIDSTVRTAIQMLENCTDDMQDKIAHSMADMVVEKFKQSEDEEEEIEI